VLGLCLDHFKQIRKPMETTNAKAINTVGKDGYNIMAGHAVFSSVRTGHHTLFRLYIIHEVALASLYKQSTNQLRMYTLVHLYYK
jgi:hypothetical protein